MLTAAILRYLDSEGLVVFGRIGTNAFLEGFRDLPVEQVVAFSRPGGTNTDGGHGYDEPAFQLVARGAEKNARSGHTLATSLRDALHGLSQTLLAAGTEDEVYLIQCIARTSEPVNLGDDTDGRPRWSLQFDTETRNVTALRP